MKYLLILMILVSCSYSESETRVIKQKALKICECLGGLRYAKPWGMFNEKFEIKCNKGYTYYINLDTITGECSK